MSEGRLDHDHTPEAIAERVNAATQHSYLGDGVLGAIDGTVTTFAIVAAASGAGFSSGVAVVFGFANVVADGFSMAVSNYLKAKSDRDHVAKTRAMEERHIDTVPDGEREEVRHIFREKGFSGETLERIVETITEDRQRWLDTMITEEHGLPLETPHPVKAAAYTFLAFILAGMLPLLVLWGTNSFLWSAIATAVTFFGIGVIKARLLGGKMLVEGLETLFVGGSAAALAFFIARATKHLAT